MTDEPVNTGENRRPGAFTKGDKRINRKGRPRVPKSAVELNKLIDEIAAEDVVNPATGEQVQRIRAMLRSMMTGKDSRGKVHLLDRRYGKVKDELDITSNGESLAPKVDNERFDRAISTFVDAVRESLPNKGTGTDSDMGSAK